MGTGTDVAVEASDLTLVRGALRAAGVLVGVRGLQQPAAARIPTGRRQGRVPLTQGDGLDVAGNRPNR